MVKVSNDLKSRIVVGVPLAVAGLLLLLNWLTTAIVVTLLLGAFVYEVLSKLLGKPRPTAKAWLVTVLFFAVGYTGFLCANAIRDGKHGFYNVLIVALGVVFTDSFAYFGGKLFGKTRFAPDISPNKTLEGVACGIAAGVLALWGLWTWMKAGNNTSFSTTNVAWLMALPVVAVCGDLLESKSKRLLGIKDFGTWLGAHGGIADRFDAMTASFLYAGLVLHFVS